MLFSEGLKMNRLNALLNEIYLMIITFFTLFGIEWAINKYQNHLDELSRQKKEELLMQHELNLILQGSLSSDYKALTLAIRLELQEAWALERERVEMYEEEWRQRRYTVASFFLPRTSSKTSRVGCKMVLYRGGILPIRYELCMEKLLNVWFDNFTFFKLEATFHPIQLLEYLKKVEVSEERSITTCNDVIFPFKKLSKYDSEDYFGDLDSDCSLQSLEKVFMEQDEAIPETLGAEVQGIRSNVGSVPFKNTNEHNPLAKLSKKQIDAFCKTDEKEYCLHCNDLDPQQLKKDIQPFSPESWPCFPTYYNLQRFH